MMILIFLISNSILIMRIKELQHMQFTTVLPGDYQIAARDTVLTTLLGSCVAACLYDPRQRVIGMNHFLLCGRHREHDRPLLITDAGRYGVHAMELLINEMLQNGARRGNLRAKVFGGATVLRSAGVSVQKRSVGELNAEFVREFLHHEQIPIAAEDLGGTLGRVIYFSGEDYTVYGRKIPRTNLKKIIDSELKLLRAGKTQPPRKSGDDELWL